MSRPSRTQLALLVEMAEGPGERRLIDAKTAIRTSWVREPGKRQVERNTVRALVTLGLLTDRDGATGWWLTPAGRRAVDAVLAKARGES